jgi:hypothetical protein
MSALRRLLASLWAAVWLRGRLLRIRVRRLFGGDPTTAAGNDYYLTAAETPVEGVDYDPSELPAELAVKLDAARAELLDRARSARTGRPDRRRARRRRSFSVATATVLTLALLGGGAAALVTGSTGVPAVDRLLGIFETELDRPAASGQAGGPGRAAQPRSSGASSVEAPVGSRRIVSTSYVAENGRICSVLTDEDERQAAGDVACVTADRLAALLARDDGMVLAVVGESDGVVLRGFVAGDVTSLGGRGPGGPLDVRLGATWTPDVSGAVEVRPFVAVGDPDRDGLANPDDYALRALNDDGGSSAISP